MNSGATILTSLKSRYFRIRLLEVGMLSTSAALILYAILLLFMSESFNQITISTLVGVVLFAVRFFQIGLHKITEQSFAAFLNIQYSELQASTDLLLTEHDLSPLAKLQQIRTQKNLESLNNAVRFPNQVKIFSIITLVSLTACIIIKQNDFTIKVSDPLNIADGTTNQKTIITKNLPAEISKASITITPPVYTRIKSYSTNDFNLTIPENSTVTWSLELSGTVKNVALVASSRDTLTFTPDNSGWKISAVFDRNGFYQLLWRDESVHTSDYFKIILIKDQPPTIKLSNLNQFTQVAVNSKQSIEVNPVITDDYGLTNAYIIATVSKGSGESVKFREEKIRFSKSEVTGKQFTTVQTLDLKKLSMEPGDELYFYVEAFDNKTPLPNRSRTETYFISIPDTARDVMTADGGLGVDLMPEYFRSQRQIIIDTEKLIREKKTITKKEFNSRSNELGYDQKVLRLRYGQFLGEEAESGIGPIEQHADHEGEDDDKKPEDIIKEFGHQHDTENEHNLVEEKDQAKKDVDGSKKEDLLADFVHAHDNEESATFFYQSLKMKLKAALAQMWDAELYLRLYEPDKSLPYQYTALKLLKEISNDSRIYVHRTGFEPPPIKEEKRLSADLTEIFNSNRNYEVLISEYFPKMSEALRVTEKLITRTASTISQQDKHILIQSGNELAQAALENPGLLQGLRALKELTTENGTVKIEALKTLQKSIWLALPKKPAQAGKINSALHELDNALIQQLELLDQ